MMRSWILALMLGVGLVGCGGEAEEESSADREVASSQVAHYECGNYCNEENYVSAAGSLSVAKALASEKCKRAGDRYCTNDRCIRCSHHDAQNQATTDSATYVCTFDGGHPVTDSIRQSAYNLVYFQCLGSFVPSVCKTGIACIQR